MQRRLAFLLAGTMLAGCTVNSGVSTTPTFSQARFVPASPSVPTAPLTKTELDMRARGGIQIAPTYSGPIVTGRAAVIQATREATVEPNSSSMFGATWMVPDPDPSVIYRVPTSKGKVTTILLPAAGKFNAAVGGDVEAFLINTSYAGLRPAVSILPRTPKARGNLQLVTTDGFYSFDLVPSGGVAINLVDLERTKRRGEQADGRIVLGVATSEWPQPVGDYTALALLPLEGKSRPAWSPVEAWADSTKLVVRFDGPLPVMPALFAGMKGEQMISYRTLMVGQTPFLVTDRRVTEAELRVDSEVLRVTTDPDGVKAGLSADPAQGSDGWKTSEALPEPKAAAAQNNVAVFVMPNGTAMTGTLSADTFGTSGTLMIPADVASQPPPVPARQPMANGLVM
jgi:hypothetical protein